MLSNRPHRLILAGAALSLLACAQEKQDNWTRHESPHGFSLEHPRGWTVEARGAEKIRIRGAAGQGFAHVEAIPIRPGQTPVHALDQYLRGSSLAAAVEIVKLREQSGGARAQVRWTAGGADHRAEVLLAAAGSVGTMMAVAAPEAGLAAAAPVLVRVLKSLRFTAPGGSSAGQSQDATTPRTRFVPARDPGGAFTVEAPEGWRTQAQMFLPSLGDLRPEVLSESPSGILVALGDRHLGRFLQPTPGLQQMGAREGMSYQTPSGTTMVIMRYLPGAMLGDWLIPNKFPGARITARRERADLQQSLAAARYRAGNAMNASLHAGEVEFEHQGKRGLLVAATEFTPGFAAAGGEGAMWSVIWLASTLAPKTQWDEALAATGHMAGTLRIDPRWLMQTMRLSREVHAAAMEAQEHTNRLARQVFAERAEQSDRHARIRGDLVSGTFRLRDPNTGEQTTAAATHNFYYRPNDFRTNDQVWGSNRQLTPGEGIDVTALQILDW